MNAPISVRYSRGTSRFDNKPAQREAADFDAFVDAVLSDRAMTKGKTYVCASMAEGQHSEPAKHAGLATWRQKHLAQPRAFLPFDLDGFDTPETFEQVRHWFGRFQGFAYTTASHKPDAPRCRVMLAQSRATGREEGKTLCQAVQAMIARDMGAGRVKFDESVYKAEQPLFTPLHGAEVFRFDGAPVDVDAVLVESPPVEDRDSRPTSTAAIACDDLVMAALDLSGRVKRDMGGGKYAVQCPCDADHSGESNETSTVYYLPNFGGVKYGKFHCMHDHCRDRPQEQFIEALGLNPREVWAAQRGERFREGRDDSDTVAWLAGLSAFEYDRCREAEAERLGVLVSTLDKEVRTARGETISEDDPLGGVTPWAHPVEGALLLEEVVDTIRRFIVCDVKTARASALWVALTWLIDTVDVAPLAVITAPEKRCGKTQMLSVLGKLVRHPMSASNISAAALFRSIDAWHPTLLVDEADAFMRDNEELRGLLNSGHTRDSAYVVRVVGDDHTPTRFTTWGCKAIAGIGHLADTLMDRAIVLALRRKLAHESTERLRHAGAGLFEDLAAKLARFAQDNTEAVRRARPVLPPALNDRAQDNWEPLLSIAEVAGGDWPALAREAALKLSGGEPDSTVGDELLADIREIFYGRQEAKITTTGLLRALCLDEEKPWATHSQGRPLSHHQLARKLRSFDIHSKNVRIGHEVAKGFDRSQFEDAFARYLPSLTPPAEPATSLQPSTHAGLGVADGERVAATANLSATREPLLALDCSDVAGFAGGAGEAYRGVTADDLA